MALLDLYMQTTGSDFNAGTDQTDAPTAIASVSYSVTGGTLTFTGASGAIGTTGATVGSWVSLYNSTDTVARFTGQIATTDGTTITVLYNSGTGYSTTGLGLATGLSAGTIYCRVGGAWKSFAIAGTGGAMNAPASSGAMTASTYNGLRVNVKSGTYSHSSAVSLPVALTSKPIWWRGYYSTIGDIDNCANVSGTLVGGPSGATRPLIAFTGTSSGLTVGNYQWLENLEITSDGTAATVTISNGAVHRCRVTVYGQSYGISGSNILITGCLISTTRTTGVSLILAGSTTHVFGSVIKGVGGNNGIFANGTVNCLFCLFVSLGNAVNLQNTSTQLFINNTFYNCGNGILVAGTWTLNLLSANNVFSACTTGINLGSMTNNRWSHAINNDFHNITTGIANLFESLNRGPGTGSAAYTPITESASPFLNAGTDYTLTTSANARQNGFPGQFEV